MDQISSPRRRRSFGWLIPSLLLAVVVVGWSAFWFYAADRARDTIDGWIEREAVAGRIYACGSQSLGGFPFRIEFRCDKANAEFTSNRPPLNLSASHVLAAAQIYQPTLVIAEIGGPLSVSDPGQPPKITADWSLAQVSARGTPRNPQRVSFVSDKFVLDEVGGDGAGPERLFEAEKAQLHGRLASGTVRENPVIDIAAAFKRAMAAGLHPLAADPFDFDGDARLIGLKDFRPKPWTDRFREIQRADGRIEIRNARLKQGDLLAVATGTLTLTPSGHLDGALQVTASGIERVLPALGRDMLARQGGSRSQRLGAALGLLDQMAPGALAGAMTFLGEQVELEGRRAIRMPLRFKDGVATLGPVKLGQVPALF